MPGTPIDEGTTFGVVQRNKPNTSSLTTSRKYGLSRSAFISSAPPKITHTKTVDQRCRKVTSRATPGV